MKFLRVVCRFLSGLIVMSGLVAVALMFGWSMMTLIQSVSAVSFFFLAVMAVSGGLVVLFLGLAAWEIGSFVCPIWREDENERFGL